MDKEAIKMWLEQCPLPIVDRVIDNSEDLQFLLSTAHMYEQDMLVVVNLHKIGTKKED